MTPLQIVEHYKLVDHFTMNLDETCMQANNSNLKIIGSKSKHKHEKKVIAKRRIDMASGNVSSYARVFNSPHQLEKIGTFNELAATMTTLKKERGQAREEASAWKKQEEKDKAARKAEKEIEAINKLNELGPICKDHVDKGLAHILTLKVPQQREILRYHFQVATVEIDDVSKPIYKLSLAETSIALQRLMPGMPQLPMDTANYGSIEVNGDGESAVRMDVDVAEM